MRVVKDPEIRKNEILDAAEELFETQGFDGTSTNQILEKVGIARGTLYYHFKSKEDIMDGLIQRYNNRIMDKAKKAAGDKKQPVFQRILQVILALNVNQDGVREHLHKPQNALMHQKIQKMLISSVTPILAELAEEGISQKVMENPYPYETMEMVLVYASAAFDDDDTVAMTEEERLVRAHAMVFNIERLFAVKDEQLSKLLMQIFTK
ncbi:TetR/AcrR family transcriptional regulator [Enterococcus sp. LJL128]